MKIKIPNDPTIAACDEKKAMKSQKAGERLKISSQKEQRRHEFSLERQDSSRALVDVDGRDVGRVAYEEDLRRFDSQEAGLLREIKNIEPELDALQRQRSKLIVTENRPTYLDILRRRAHALIEVAKLNDLELQFYQAMSDADVGSGLRPMGIKAVGAWSDSQSLARFHVAELRTYFPELANEDFLR